MRGNPFLRVSSTHPHHWSGPVGDGAYSGRTRKDVDQSDNAAVKGITKQVPESPPTAEGLNRRSYNEGQSTSAQSSGTWQDYLLTDIEDLVSELRFKLARYSLIRSGQSFDEVSSPANQSAVEWMHGALEDIAATALGIELVSTEASARVKSAAEQAIMTEINQEPKSGTAG